MLAEHLFARTDRGSHVGHADARRVVRAAGAAGGGSTPTAMGPEWAGIDVGSPFAHGRSGILYVAKHLPPPGRDGLPPEYLEELWELIKAAGGRTLGLFSSMRAAKAAAAALRESLPFPVLCQGDDSTMQLVKEFAEDEPTCLFGTLSLWQGVDVPGPSLRLVVIDRIPFPRPDDPLASARTRAADARGGNGFMEVSAATRRCCSPRARGGCCGRWTTAAWWPCSTRGWSPSGTASTCGRRCRRSGRRPTPRWSAARCGGSRPGLTADAGRKPTGVLADRVGPRVGSLCGPFLLMGIVRREAEGVEQVALPEVHGRLFRVGSTSGWRS